MSISLIRDQRLWGLIACHHRTPRLLPYARRAACELLGQIMSAHLSAKEEAARQTANLAARAVQMRFFDYFSREDRYVDALIKYTPSLLEFLGATEPRSASTVKSRCSVKRRKSRRSPRCWSGFEPSRTRASSRLTTSAHWTLMQGNMQVWRAECSRWPSRS
jgi:hypothetical protein